MDFNIYLECGSDKFCDSWPEYASLVVDHFEKIPRRHTLILHKDIEVIDSNFFNQIDDLISANNYLDALKHPAWIVFGNEFVKLNSGRDYWNLNLRPVIGFDDSTWRYHD